MPGWKLHCPATVPGPDVLLVFQAVLTDKKAPS